VQLYLFFHFIVIRGLCFSYHFKKTYKNQISSKRNFLLRLPHLHFYLKAKPKHQQREEFHPWRFE